MSQSGTIAIMQPYFFPYLGYFALLKKADCFVIADDLNYIKGGYINRNYILGGSENTRITLQLKQASQNKLINEIERGDNSMALLHTIEHTYKKAPYFAAVFPMLKKVLSDEEQNLAKFLGNSLEMIRSYLGLSCQIVYSSDIEKDLALKFDKRIIDICQRLGYDHYINASGGKVLYDKEVFASKGIRLNFIDCKLNEYKQFGDEFRASLSIIDVLMFNSIDEINSQLDQCVLV